jgi:hypothetical protein
VRGCWHCWQRRSVGRRECEGMCGTDLGERVWRWHFDARLIGEERALPLGSSGAAAVQDDAWQGLAARWMNHDVSAETPGGRDEPIAKSCTHFGSVQGGVASSRTFPRKRLSAVKLANCSIDPVGCSVICRRLIEERRSGLRAYFAGRAIPSKLPP